MKCNTYKYMQYYLGDIDNIKEMSESKSLDSYIDCIGYEKQN